MKKFNEYLDESLALELKKEPKSAAAQQARQMGLTYAGFGKYLDKKGKLAYVVERGKLVPFKTADDAEKLQMKAGELEWKEKGEKNDASWKSAEKKSPAKGKKPAAKKAPPKESKSEILYKQAEEIYNRANRLGEQDWKRKRKIENDSAKLNQKLMNAYYSYLRQVSRERPDIVDSLQYYTEDGYEEINKYLYQGHEEGANVTKDFHVRKMIENIDELIDGAEAPMDYTVYTGLSARYTVKNLKAGEDYLFRGYVSASISPQIAHDTFTNMNYNAKEKIILQIDIQTGQKALHVDEWSFNGGEMETMLPRGSMVRIISGPHRMKSSMISTQVGEDNLEEDKDTYLYHCVLVQDEDE